MNPLPGKNLCYLIISPNINGWLRLRVTWMNFTVPLDTLRNCIFGIFMAFLMLMLPIIVKICSSITTPLYELMERFESVSSGDFTVRMLNNSRDEIGQLTVYFNRFMEQLETYHNSLQAEIQERRMAQEAQKESRERYYLLMEAAPDPIITYDVKGDVIYINPAFTKVFGWSMEECVGNKMDHFVPEGSWNETQMMINEILAGNAINNVETRRYSKHTQTVHVSISGAPTRDHNGKFVRQYHHPSGHHQIKTAGKTAAACRGTGTPGDRTKSPR